jgi:integrase
MNDEIAKLKNIESKKEYIHARQIVLARVTLINGRRGSEPVHLLIRDYQDRHTWLNKSKLNAKQNAVLERYSIAYVMGKGTSLVSVFFPKSCERAIELLIHPENRKMAGVAEDNQYLFAYTNKSTDNIIGYNEIQIVCQSIGIRVIAPTSVRHRTSTFFWKKDGLEEDTIDSMMDHMGHSKDIDKNIYCVPPAARALSIVAPIIDELDKV